MSLLFFKKGTTPKTSILQAKQEDGSDLHMTNALTGTISTPILVILEDVIVIFLHVIEYH
jgi:hypothetical protein